VFGNNEFNQTVLPGKAGVAADTISQISFGQPEKPLLLLHLCYIAASSSQQPPPIKQQ